MFMMNIKNTISSIAIGKNKLEDIVTYSNNFMCRGNDNMMFVTLWIASYNIKNKEFSYLNAGHCPAFIKKKNNDVIVLENKPQPFLGIFPDYKYHADTYKVETGDLFYLYTDGATDALNPAEEVYGLDRLIATIKESEHDVKHVCNNVITKITEFSSSTEQFDDITQICVTFEEYMYDKTFTCEYENIDIITSTLNADLVKHNVNEDTINLINSAIDDLLDNIISYAYDDHKNTFRFQYNIQDNNLSVVVSDHGKKFNPLTVKKADLSINRPIGGLGIHLIKSIMDDVEYSRNNNTNILVLNKKIL